MKQPTQTLKLAADPTRNSVKRYQVTVTDAYGCRATDEVKVTVLSRPEARTTLVQPTCGRRDGSITFRFRNHRDQSDMEFSITGKTGRYKRVKDKAGVLTFSRLQAGRYDAWVRWGNDACPVSLGRIQLTDRPGPQIDAGPDQVVCEGDPVRLKVANNKNWSYLWSNKVKRPSQTLYLDAPDYRNLVRNYTISVTDKKSGCTTTDAVKVTVLSRPIVSAAYVRPNCGRADGSIALSFRDHRDQRYIEFSLSGKDGRYRRRPDDAGTVTFGRLAAGTYDVWARWPGGKCAVRVQRITLREKGNCLRSDDAPVLFRESVQDTLMGMEEAAPPTVLPNRTGSEELLAKLEVFPNPARSGGSVTIRYFATQTGRPLQIFSAAGQLVRRIDASTLATGWNEMTVDLMNLASGSYFVADGYGNHAVFAIIK